MITVEFVCPADGCGEGHGLSAAPLACILRTPNKTAPASVPGGAPFGEAARRTPPRARFC